MLFRSSLVTTLVAGSVNQIDLGATNRTFNITAGTTTLGKYVTVSGTGGLTKTGAGTLTFDLTAGTNGVSVGTLAVNEGTVSWLKNEQLADATNVTAGGGVVNINGATETFTSYTQTAGNMATGLNGNLTITGTSTFSGGTAFIVGSGSNASLNSAVFSGAGATLGNNSTANVTKLIIGAGGLTLNGQTLTMNRAATAGILGNEITLNGNVTTTGTSAITFESDGAIISGAVGQVNLGASTRTWDVTGTTTVVTPIVGAGGLTKTGNGSLILAGVNANTYSGTTTVSAGTLNLGKSANIDAIAGNISVSGGTLLLGQNNQIKDTSSLTLSTGTISFNTKAETFTNFTKTGGEVNGTGGNITITGLFSASGGTSNGADVNSSIYTINSGGQTSANAVDFSGATKTATLLVGGNSAATVTRFIVGAGGIALRNNNMTFNREQEGSELVLNGDVTAGGTNSINIGTLGATGSRIAQVNQGTATRTWNITDGTTTSNAPVVGTGGLTKTGAGTLTLNTANTYSGKTTVSGGSLTLGAAGTIDSSPWIEIESGGTLNTSAVTGGYAYASGGNGVISGTGTIQGSLTVGAGKVLKPGSSTNAANVLTAGANAGTMTITSSLLFAPATKLTIAEFNILNASTSDQIIIGSNLTLNANSDFMVTFDSSFTNQAVGQSWTLVDWAGVLTAGGFSTGTNLRTGLDSDGNEGNLFLPTLNTGLLWNISNFSGSGALTISIVGAVPEPSRALLIGAGLALTFLRRRRSR